MYRVVRRVEGGACAGGSTPQASAGARSGAAPRAASAASNPSADGIMRLLGWCGLVALSREACCAGGLWGVDCMEDGARDQLELKLLATATAVVLIPTVPRSIRGEGYLRRTLESLDQAWAARPSHSPFERLHVVVYSGTSWQRKQRHKAFEELADEYSAARKPGPTIHFIDSSSIPCSVHRRVTAASTGQKWWSSSSTHAPCAVAAPKPRDPITLPERKQAQTMDYTMLLAAAVHLAASSKTVANHTWPPLVFLEDDNEVCADVFEQLVRVTQSISRPFGFVKIAMGGNFLFDGGIHQPGMLWELTSFMLANIATLPVDVAIHEYYRQQASIGAQAAAHYALHQSVAWHRGIKSTFSGTQWKDEKTVQGNASLAAVKSCNSHRLELQQGGNFQRCSDPVISSLMWCDADSNRMHLGGNTLPAQHALISAIQEESSCVNADTNWKSLLGFVAVLVWIVVLLKTSKYTPTRSTLCSYAARSSRRCCWLGLLMPFFFFGSWLELHSGTHGTDVTATYRGDLQASSLTPKVHGSSYGGWWACVNTNQLYDSSMERLDLRRENFHNQGNAKQLEPSTLPLTVVVQTEWLVEQRGSQVAAMLTTQPPVAYSTFSEVVVNRGTLYDQAKDPRGLHSALHLLGVGDLMLGNERGYVRSLHAGVRVRASLEVTSTAGCDGRWNFGVVLHDLPTQQYRLGPMAGELYVRFHTTHLANGHIGLIGMDTVESPLRRFASYSLPSVRLGAQTTMGATESLALLLVVEASPSDSTVFVRAMAAGDGSALASLRLCRAEFVALERVGAVSLRVEGDPTCVASEQGLTASGTNRNVVVSLSNFSAEQCVK